eukprot:g4316.t1
MKRCQGCAGGNLYAGTLDIHGKPNGKGVLYYLESGECDVGTFSPDMKQTGIGVRFNRERDKAFGLENGRHKGLIPSAFGYNKTRTEQVKAWYKYRSLANLSMTESCYGVVVRASRPEPLTPPSEPRFSTYSREFLDRRRDRGDRGDRHDRPHRAPLGDPRERGSKTLSMVLRHRQLPAMRKDGFIPWEAVLQCDELQGRYCSKDLVEVIEWSHNKDKQRRFEMALNLDDKGGIWVRATGRHTNGCDASQLPDGVTEATRSESDQNAMEAARRYSGPGSVREHRERGYPRHDFGRGPPRPVARPLDAAPPKPPVGVPVAPAPNGPTELPTIRKVISTQLAPPILEEPIREEPSDKDTQS